MAGLKLAIKGLSIPASATNVGWRLNITVRSNIWGIIPSMFNTNPKDLKALLNEVHSEALQLPDFQRDWVWTDEGVRQLLASVAAGFPIGAILTLETGGELKFKTRALAHAPTTGFEREYRTNWEAR
ncbi:MAG: DUF262 domain-containing protein, partial [Pseudomonadota bacterium]